MYANFGNLAAVYGEINHILLPGSGPPRTEQIAVLIGQFVSNSIVLSLLKQVNFVKILPFWPLLALFVPIFATLAVIYGEINHILLPGSGPPRAEQISVLIGQFVPKSIVLTLLKQVNFVKILPFWPLFGTIWC